MISIHVAVVVGTNAELRRLRVLTGRIPISVSGHFAAGRLVQCVRYEYMTGQCVTAPTFQVQALCQCLTEP